MDFKLEFSGTGHRYTPEEVDVVQQVMQTASPLTQGKYRDLFENKFAAYLGVKHAFTVNNATNALEITAQLCLFREGDEILCPSHTFTASLYPFVKKGAKPVWVDIDPETRVVSLENIKKAVTPKTKAIIAVHLYGYCIDDIELIEKFARERNILLIEDVAQAMGTEVNGKKAGTFGDFAIFSFHSHKNMTTLGEGGMLVVKDEKYAKIIPMLRHNGHAPYAFEREDYWIPATGNVDLPELEGNILYPNNYCLGEVECALGAKLLDRVDKMNSEKRTRALKFIDSVSPYGLLKFHRVETKQHNYHLLVAQVKDDKRDELFRKMAYEKKIQCVVQYYPLNRYDLYKKLGFSEAQCPNADQFYDNMISFPFHHWMRDEEFEYLTESTIQAIKEVNG